VSHARLASRESTVLLSGVVLERKLLNIKQTVVYTEGVCNSSYIHRLNLIIYFVCVLCMLVTLFAKLEISSFQARDVNVN